MPIKLEEKTWQSFFLNEIFNDFQRGKRITRNEQISGHIPYVSSTSINNGVDNFIKNNKSVRIFSNCLTIANSGSIGESFYHSYKFVASDHVTHLKNENFNNFIYLFIANQLKKNTVKYNFNREINDRRIFRDKIMLPVDEQGQPDWLFMENYIKEIQQIKKDTYKMYAKKSYNKLSYKEVPALEEKQWKPFRLGSLFTIKIGKNIDGNKIDKSSGNFPYITRKETNNGNDGFIHYDKSYMITDVPVITIGNETATPFVQTKPFFTGTKVNIMKCRDDIDIYGLLFIAQSMKRQKEKFSYSYTINSNRLKKQTILLPVNEKGEPDYDYMAQYMMNIELEKRQQYLDYQNMKHIGLNITKNVTKSFIIFYNIFILFFTIFLKMTYTCIVFNK